ncbi:cell wall assembly regulator SMI1 [Neisseria sp. HSC-16F19]|nr:SMI1/KNR4 family protein [Neisseria sp. HSC-16F19]MCP2041422.1 cell wall assembly regulator SMI1 [Neisseria sp. HSC-16F19]
MENLLIRIKTQIARLENVSQPERKIELRAGANDTDFARLESLLGFPLPEDFKELYRIHNGEAGGNSFFMGEEWLSVNRILAEYEMWLYLYEDDGFCEDDSDYGCESDDGIKPNYWWNPRWIPFTAGAAGESLMIDLDPAPNGHTGQIIRVWPDDPTRQIIAVSLRELLAGYAEALENNQYIIDPVYGGITRQSS